MNNSFKTLKSTETKTFQYNLEALRGIAALVVVFDHVLGFENLLNPNYHPDALNLFRLPSHLSVLIFFVLSGYVIGISNRKRIEVQGILPYIKKRFVRLYPIYLVTIVGTLLLVNSNYSNFSILSNLTFQQVLLTKSIDELSPIWSLHYEVLYYLLFIPISFFNLNPIKIVAASFVLGFVNYILFPQFSQPIVTSYLFGLVFWCSGLTLATLPIGDKIDIDYTRLVSNIFLIFCLDYYNTLTTFIAYILNKIIGGPIAFPETFDWTHRAVTFSDLTYLPYCIFIILAFLGINYRYKKTIEVVLQILPAIKIISVLTLYYTKSESISNIKESAYEYMGAGVFYLMSCLLYFMNSARINLYCQNIMRKGVWIGSISYGIYIVHKPILHLFGRTTFFSGSILSFICRLVLFIFITIIVSFVLEKKFQPWASRKLTKPIV